MNIHVIIVDHLLIINKNARDCKGSRVAEAVDF